MKKTWAILCICMLLLCACGKTSGGSSETETDAKAAESKGTLILATTTSTKDSGLLDEILPVFESATGYRVDVVSVGSGEAMRPMCFWSILRHLKKLLLRRDMQMKTEEKTLCIMTLF